MKLRTSWILSIFRNNAVSIFPAAKVFEYLRGFFVFVFAFEFGFSTVAIIDPDPSTILSKRISSYPSTLLLLRAQFTRARPIKYTGNGSSIRNRTVSDGYYFQSKMEELRSRRIHRIVEGFLPKSMDPKDRASETDLLLQFCLSLSKVSEDKQLFFFPFTR